MAAKPSIKVKQGDSFSLDLTVLDKNNDLAIANLATQTAAEEAYLAALALDPANPAAVAAALVTLQNAQAAYTESITVDITGWTIASEIRWCGKLITTLTVTITDAETGTFAIAATAEQTQLWKPRIHECDIEFTAALFGKQSSQTFLLDVERGVTNV